MKLNLSRLKLNRIVKALIYSDLVFYTGWGLISPIFAVFILNSIADGSTMVVGIAAAINMIVRSVFRVPFGMYADKGKHLAYRFMFWGLFVTALVPLGYIFCSYAWQIYVMQCIYGISIAMSTSGWTSIFSKHMDKGKESTEWGLDSVAAGLGPGIAAAVGGIAVTYTSFKAVFAIVTLVGLVGVFILLGAKSELNKHNSRKLPAIKRLVPRIVTNHNNH